MKRLALKHRIQLDNSLYPTGSCNTTSVAMVVEFLTNFSRVPSTIDNQPYGQFEDKLLAYCDLVGLSRHEHDHLRELLELCGVVDDLRLDGTAKQIRAHIDKGFPCISAGFYTSFGHIVVISGYNDRGFVIHDPYGEWCAEGYLRNYGDSDFGNGYVLSYETWSFLHVDSVGALVHFCSVA